MLFGVVIPLGLANGVLDTECALQETWIGWVYTLVLIT